MITAAICGQGVYQPQSVCDCAQQRRSDALQWFRSSSRSSKTVVWEPFVILIGTGMEWFWELWGWLGVGACELFRCQLFS